MQTIEANKWYSVKAVIDTNMDTYDLYVGNVKIITGENLGSEAAGAVDAEAINHLDFIPWIDANQPEGVNFYIDNLMVFAQEGPELAGGALYKADGTKVSGTDAVPRNADYLLLSFNTTPDAQIDPSTLTESTVQLKTADGTSIPYTGSYDAKANTYKVKWNSMLAYGTEYICTVTTGIRDTNNLSLQQESTFSFTTLSTDYYVSAAGYYDGQGAAITSVGSNSTITAKVTFANETADAANATVIIARFKDGVCKGIAYEDGTVQSTGDTISATITGVQAGETIRTFVWDSAATMRPIWAKAGRFTLN